jgi:N-methylhydantoinase A/oxoprolinase/acetone carboxylase beta subunit
VTETRLGVDVGRTRTAAVVLDAAGRALARAVAPDLQGALAGLTGQAPGLAVLDAGTLATDALGSGRVARAAVVRIGAPLTLAVPPLAMWPPGLRSAVSAGAAVVAGGAEFDGTAAPLDEDAIARFLERAAPAAVAVTAVFAPIAPEQELAAAEVVRRTLGPDVPVALSHEFGTLGLLERENATVLNAALTGVFDELAATLRSALPAAEPYLARGDGTLMALAPALRLPVAAVGSGPASALLGAFRLTGVDDAVVAIAERSGIAVGALRNGFPRESPRTARIAGVLAGLRLPDIRTVGDAAGLAVGVARFAGGGRRPVLVAVGGASERVPEALAGVGEVIHPPDGEFARAIGAAFGVAGGEAERVCFDRADLRRSALRDARAAASERAVHFGADPGAVTIVEVEETPLASLPEPAIRIRVRAVGAP